MNLLEQESSSGLYPSQSQISHLIDDINSQAIPSSHVLPLNEAWSSPAILKRATLSENTLFASSLTSLDDDVHDEIDTRPRKKRKSWRDVKIWRTTDKAQSSSSDGENHSLVGSMDNEEQVQKAGSECDSAIKPQPNKSNDPDAQYISDRIEGRPESEQHTVQEERGVAPLEEMQAVNTRVLGERYTDTGSQISTSDAIQKPDSGCEQGQKKELAKDQDDNPFETRPGSMKSVDGGFSDLSYQHSAQTQLDQASTTVSASLVPDTLISLQEPTIDRPDSIPDAIPIICTEPEDTDQSMQPIPRLQMGTSDIGINYTATEASTWRPHTPSLEPVRSPALPVPSPLPRDSVDGLTQDSELVKSLPEPLLAPKPHTLEPATNRIQKSPSPEQLPRTSSQKAFDTLRSGEDTNQHHISEKINDSPSPQNKENETQSAEVQETQFPDFESRPDILEKDGSGNGNQSAEETIPTNNQSMRERSRFSTYRSTDRTYGSVISTSSSDETADGSDDNSRIPASNLSKLQSPERIRNEYYAKLVGANMDERRVLTEGRKEASAVGTDKDDIESGRLDDFDELDKLDEDNQDEDEEEGRGRGRGRGTGSGIRFSR